MQTREEIKAEWSNGETLLRLTLSAYLHVSRDDWSRLIDGFFDREGVCYCLILRTEEEAEAASDDWEVFANIRELQVYAINAERAVRGSAARRKILAERGVRGSAARRKILYGLTLDDANEIAEILGKEQMTREQLDNQDLAGAPAESERQLTNNERERLEELRQEWAPGAATPLVHTLSDAEVLESTEGMAIRDDPPPAWSHRDILMYLRGYMTRERSAYSNCAGSLRAFIAVAETCDLSDEAAGDNRTPAESED